MMKVEVKKEPFRWLSWLYLFVLTLGACSDPTRFSRVDSADSHLTFTNQVIESDTVNLALQLLLLQRGRRDHRRF